VGTKGNGTDSAGKHELHRQKKREKMLIIDKIDFKPALTVFGFHTPHNHNSRVLADAA
jgi:hypothetical protein